MSDRDPAPHDPTLHDPDVLDEIELYGELVIAATESEGPLDPAVVDRILGLEPPAGS